MSDLNIQKGSDPNAGWINANVDGNAQKVQNAKNLNAATYTSTIVQSQQDQQAELAYQANAEASHPKLVPQSPNAGDPSHALAQLFSPENFQNTGEKILAKLQQWEIPGASKAEQEQYANVKVSDPAVLQLAEKLGLPPGLVLKNLQVQYNYNFEQLLRSGVAPEEANQLIFANYYPEYATTLSPQLKALLTKFQEEAAKQANKGTDLPQGWKPPTDNSEFAETLSSNFSKAFEQALAQHPELSQDQVATLRTMLYMAGAQIPNADSLKNLFNTLKQQATGELQQKYNLPPNFPLTLNTDMYNQMLVGAYRSFFQQALDNHQPPLTAQQKALIQKLIENPKLASSVPPEIQALAEEIQTLSLSQIQDRFGLPKTWVPGTKKLTSPLLDPKMQKLAQKGLDQAKEMYVKVAQMFGLTPNSETQDPDSQSVNSLLTSFASISSDEGGQDSPKTAGAATGSSQGASAASLSGLGPLGNLSSLSGLLQGTEKELYMDYLKVIGIAIQKVQEMIYKIQGASSESAKELSAAKLDMELNSLEKQRKQLEEMREKRDKGVDLGPLNDILDWSSKIMMVAIAIALAPATGGMSLIFVTAFLMDDTISKELGTDSLYQQITPEIQSFTGEIGKKIFFTDDETFGEVFGLLTNLTILTAVSACNPMFAAALLQEGRQVQTFVAICGGGKMEQEITAMSIQMALQLVVMVAMMIASGGFSAPAMMAPMISNALHISQKVVMTILKLMAVAFDLIMMSLQVTSKAVSINNNILQAQIAILRAQQEALAEETAALVAMLKKLIDKLLQILMGTTDWLLDVSTFQQQKYTKVSEITTELAS